METNTASNTHVQLRTAALLAAMVDGIGELSYASEAWVARAETVLNELLREYAAPLRDAPSITVCEIAHNAPAWLHAGDVFAWHAAISPGGVRVGTGALPAGECDFSIAADHSVLSNLARVRFGGNDPALVADARARLAAQTRWETHGAMPAHPGLQAMLREFHDRMAEVTLPRYVFMTPLWVSSARSILSNRSRLSKYASDLRSVDYVFAEEFTHTPRYGFPDGAHGGFWVRADAAGVIVGAGPLPAQLAPADALLVGRYAPVVAVGRTVNAAMTAEDRKAEEAYSRAAFRFDKAAGAPPVARSSPSGRGEMPPALGKVFLPLHDELSKRTSGEHPADYDPDMREAWRSPSFDRTPNYDPGWLRYDRVDLFGDPLSSALQY